MLYSFFHKMYYICGLAFCRLCLVWWNIRDTMSPPKTNACLFVAHPDDDTLFFHTYIKENKPYVCLMTTGYSLRRLPCFFKVMKQYGVRYRAYPLDAREKREDLLKKQIKKVLSLKDFRTIATHNRSGEYGHIEHKRVHSAVLSVIKETSFNGELLCPAELSRICDYPLDDKSVREKVDIFKKLYVTETWVLYEEEAGTPVWVGHEHLVEQKAYLE